MARRKGDKRLHKPDTRGSGFTMIPHVPLDALLVTVSPRAVAVAFAILRRFNGYNNGHIGMSMRDIAEAIGSANNPANAAAIDELERTGFLRVSRFPHGQRRANEYGFTFISYGPNGEHPATHDYLARLETEVETQKSTVSKSYTRNALRVSKSYTRGKLRVSETYTGATETCGFADPPPVSDSYTHIRNHPQGLSDPDGNTSPDTPQIPAGVSASSAAMDEPALRQFAMSFLSKAEPGSQSRLAHEAGIPGGTLSKFLRGRSLPDQYRMPLQLAVGRSFPMEARNA
ncbi:hypothetical protein [Sphingopyxis granuli]|uniref:hypothetical protein n=1 Tax=Sphingopyxis granuli TaxID=267128 RepID=UPI001BB0B2ED|nr:hypothetical protein [Sphingopyxis granuli]QUM70853.1 hypothetical protein ICN83_10605 [Sphingopyxis granuli]